MELKIRKDGDDLVMVLPEEVRARLEWQPGDILGAEIIGDGMKIVRTQTAHDRAMEIAEKVMVDYRDVFVKLAKS